MRWIVVLSSLFILSCASDDGPNTTTNDRVTIPLIINFDQDVAVTTSILTFELPGTERVVANSAEVVFVGADGLGNAVNVTEFIGKTERIGDQGSLLVKAHVDQLWSVLQPSPNAVFTGDIQIRLIDEIGVLGEGSLSGRRIDFKSLFPPTINPISGGAVFVNQRIEVSGENFLRPEEGQSIAKVSGTLTLDDGNSRDINDEEIVIQWDGSRTRARLPLDPGLFGVQVGSFEGALVFENVLSSGARFAGNTQSAFRFDIQPTFLASLTPSAGSRGQRIGFNGRGFVANADNSRYYGMIFRFEGEFVLDSGTRIDLTGDNALERAPDQVFSEEEAGMAVWYEIDGAKLTGLGAEPGSFDGTITPILFDAWGEQIGLSYGGAFRVLPTKQIVHIKYLPAFSKALEKFGVQNVEVDIRRRVQEVVSLAYEGIHVEFRETKPTDFVDFATIEIGGPDPSGGGKFGYDNTCNNSLRRCKDTDNLFLGDYLGGINAASANEFETPYGGVFIESFDYFSKILTPSNQDASDSFDDTLKPFMPTLGGDPVRGTEWPDGPRSEQIAQAIHMIGSVIGNTIAHEIGHSLGLAFFVLDRCTNPDNCEPGPFHNTVDRENAMMDSGGDRPFEERAELDGLGPARFVEQNRKYLVEILPAP
jgi:hypothetical protein